MAGKSGLDMLLSEYANSPNLKKYIKCFLDEIAEVRQALDASIRYRYLADSYGVMVDDIAYIVGASRVITGATALGYFGFYKNPQAFPAGDDNNPSVGGVLKSDNDKDSGDFVRTDMQLKNAIRARVLKIVGACTIEQTIMYLDLMIGRSLKTEIVEGSLKMEIKIHETLSVADKLILAYMIPEFKPCGVQVTLEDAAGQIQLVYSSTYYPPESLV
ncbi:hypothetical protein PM1_058 [Pectobacterium phage PM1]|uniref:Baseplate protein n=1 Tax=Pectobacterium phage PM1 TaxID=1399915 RepID=X2CT52_9CAUD|nr:structural protein [Pectobacterium phage PM1]AGV99274.1 hypothetical protein PM1_058 [Pectobacterium phage PM1]